MHQHRASVSFAKLGCVGCKDKVNREFCAIVAASYTPSEWQELQLLAKSLKTPKST